MERTCNQKPTGIVRGVIAIMTILACLSWVREQATPVLAEETWEAATPDYRLTFPRDHAAHPATRLEWWYYTGNLVTADGRHFGYQLTFFRTGVTREVANPSAWAVRDLYMAHFALSDIDGKQFHYFERLNRSGILAAGADPERYRVWNEDWEATLDGTGHVLRARDGQQGIALRLAPEKPEVLHGVAGFSQKGAATGNASHYYSLTRLRTTGTITIEGKELVVTGWSWMDHEFGTSFLEPEQVGWDWFSLQLDDGRELMLFQIRRSHGAVDPHSSGTLIDEAGRGQHLPLGSFTLTPGKTWHSDASGARYPITWTLTVPAHQLRVEVTAAFPAQELRASASTSVTYWEGSVVVNGDAGGRAVRGQGYLEMTGYVGKSMGAVLGTE